MKIKDVITILDKDDKLKVLLKYENIELNFYNIDAVNQIINIFEKENDIELFKILLNSLLNFKEKQVKNNIGIHLYFLCLMFLDDKKTLKRCFATIKSNFINYDLNNIIASKKNYDYLKQIKPNFSYSYYNLQFYLLLLDLLKDFQNKEDFLKVFWSNILYFKRKYGDEIDFMGNAPDFKFLKLILKREKVVLEPIFRISFMFNKEEIGFFTFYVDSSNSIIIDTIQGKEAKSNSNIKKGLCKFQNWKEILFDFLKFYCINNNRVNVLKIISAKNCIWTKVKYENGNPHIPEERAIEVYDLFAKNNGLKQDSFGDWSLKLQK